MTEETLKHLSLKILYEQLEKTLQELFEAITRKDEEAILSKEKEIALFHKVIIAKKNNTVLPGEVSTTVYFDELFDLLVKNTNELIALERKGSLTEFDKKKEEVQLLQRVMVTKIAENNPG